MGLVICFIYLLSILCLLNSYSDAGDNGTDINDKGKVVGADNQVNDR